MQLGSYLALIGYAWDNQMNNRMLDCATSDPLGAWCVVEREWRLLSFMTVMRIKTSETLAHNYIISITSLTATQEKQQKWKAIMSNCIAIPV